MTPKVIPGKPPLDRMNRLWGQILVGIVAFACLGPAASVFAATCNMQANLLARKGSGVPWSDSKWVNKLAFQARY